MAELTRDTNTGLVVVGEPRQPDLAARTHADAMRTDTGRVIRIATMVHHLLDELRDAPLDEEARARVQESFEASVSELIGALSPDLANEVARLTHPFRKDAASEAELRVAHAQLVGWMEGLVRGIQTTLLTQQAADIARVTERRSAAQPEPATGGVQHAPRDTRPGTYL
jgi:hypothetical protein